MLDKFHTSGSEHGIDLVAYIYGEMDAAARDRFESHLAACEECAVELGSYADARLGVIEWRRNDFEPLATPAIIIPESPQVAEPAGRRGRWMAWVERIYSLPAFAQAALGLAAASILVSIFYFALSPARNAHSSLTAAESPISPIEQKRPEAEPAKEQPRSAVTARKSEFEPRNVTAPSRRVMRSTPNPQVAGMHQTPVNRNYRRIGPLEAVATKSQSAPRLNSFEAEEDSTLRLSDLFSQVGSRDK